jgi:GT2 family glycosyltransferase
MEQLSNTYSVERQIDIIIPTLDLSRANKTAELASLTGKLYGRPQVNVIVVLDEDRDGFTSTVNEGLELTRPGSDVCLLNDDVYKFQYGWLAFLHRALHSNKKIGIVGPSGKCASSQGRGQLMPGDTGLKSVSNVSFWATLIKREVIDDIGLLDKRFIHYASDVYYCYCARKKGWKVMWFKSVYLWHRHHGSGLQSKWKRHDQKVYKRLTK